MPKPSLVEILSLPDVLLQDNFDMYFTYSPVLSETEVRDLRLRCMSTSMPGRTMEAAQVMVFGYTVNFAGRNTTTQTFTVNYVETRNLVVNRTLKRWTDLCRSKITGHGVSKQYYAGRAIIVLYSEGGAVAGELELINVWPETIPEVQLDGSSTGIIQLSASFKFDEFVWRYAGGADATASPIQVPSNLEDDG